jgi:hypothetical protein
MSDHDRYYWWRLGRMQGESITMTVKVDMTLVSRKILKIMAF